MTRVSCKRELNMSSDLLRSDGEFNMTLDDKGLIKNNAIIIRILCS